MSYLLDEPQHVHDIVEGGGFWADVQRKLRPPHGEKILTAVVVLGAGVGGVLVSGLFWLRRRSGRRARRVVERTT